ncbi:MAG: Bug family tripartite tricarboxylate transporter substrate binding protein [Betaproteobacteria bacterium]
MTIHAFHAALAFSVALFASLPAHPAYPDKPIRLVIPCPAGGGADSMARPLAAKLSAQMGQPVVLEHRAGAGGTIAAEAVAKAAPDGYSLLFGTVGTHAINPSLRSKLPYDPVKDFAPVAMTHVAPRVLVVHPSLPAADVKELVAHAKAKPGALTFGSSGNGGVNHLAGALFMSMAGVDMLHVPYKGSSPAAQDLLGGRLSMVFDSIVVWSEHIRTGKVRALGVSSPARTPALPNVPTIAESGLPGFDVANWLGVLAPAGTPPDIVARLSAELKVAMTDPAIRQQMTAAGIDTTYSTPAEFAETIRKDIAKWAVVIKATGAKVD